MKRIYVRSILGGYLLGTIFFAVAPLGLGISLIELLKPVLAPGALVTRQVMGSSTGIIPILVALAINGAIFTLLFFFYFLKTKKVD